MPADDILDELLSEPDTTNENEVLAPLLEEVELIQDYGTKLFVKSILLKAPKLFWTGPASATGKWHPPDERGVGGNVLHTKRVVRVVRLLAEAQERSPYQVDQLVAAAILHDIFKNVEWQDGSIHSDKMHPYRLDSFVEWARKEDEKFSTESTPTTLLIEEVMLEPILRLVRCHMGKWSPIPETIPLTYMDWTLHFADNIAANLHNIIDGDKIVEKRWSE